MNLNFRGLDPKIASKIHAHRIEHEHDNLTQTLECIIKQWDEPFNPHFTRTRSEMKSSEGDQVPSSRMACRATKKHSIRNISRSKTHAVNTLAQ